MELLKKLIKEHTVTGKAELNQALTVALETKNGQTRKGGFSPSQWVIGKHPRRPGAQLEEDE